MAKYYYNGVLLPEIPNDVLADYPYCWIRKDLGINVYELIVYKNSCWYSDNAIYPDYEEKISYTIPITTAESAEEWAYYTTQSRYGVTVTDGGDYPFVWSNHDIPNGSRTGTTIKFYGSEPVPEGGSEPEPTYDEKYAVTTEWLVSVADEVRRLTGTEDKLTTEQIETGLKGVTVGGGGIDFYSEAKRME